MSGPARGRCEVLAHGRAGAYHTLSFAAPWVAAGVRAGQFVGLLPQGGGWPLLRRPFSVHTADPAAGTVGVVFDVVGPGTRWLAGLRPGDAVDVLGPLGRPFAVPPSHRGTPAGFPGAPPAGVVAGGPDGDGACPPACLLVGGGYGAAPLFLLARELRGRGCPLHLVVGAASAGRLLLPASGAGLDGSLTVTTDDGSAGRRGLATDPMPELLARAGPAQVYACGPMPMLTAVSQVAAATGAACQVAVEERMACGTGICFSCVVPVRDGPGQASRMARSCTEGPVFDGQAVAWDELGLGPARLAPTRAPEPVP